MANGYFPDWDEWKNLTQEQREYEQYRILNFVHAETKAIRHACSKRMEECSGKFRCIEDSVEKKKWWDRTAAGGGGIIGGALAYLGLKIGG